MLKKEPQGEETAWYFEYHSPTIDVFALTNAGTLAQRDGALIKLARWLRACLKGGVAQHRAEFVSFFASSLCDTALFLTAAVWGWYPRSDPMPPEAEVMMEFCELARATFRRRTRGPLFIRHTPTTPRHLLGGKARTDPRWQFRTLHVNPAWSGRLAGKTVVVLDDYLTFGLSFAVASALLRAAGAARVVGVSLGKYPNRAKVFDIRVRSQANVFAPLQAHDFSLRSVTPMRGVERPEAQAVFKRRFQPLL